MTHLYTTALTVMKWASDENILLERGFTKERSDSEWADFMGEVSPISQEEAEARYQQGLPLAATFLIMGAKAPGLGIAAGRPNVPTPIKESTIVIFSGVVAARGDIPDYNPGKLPFSLHYFKMEGKLVKSPKPEDR